MTTPTSTPDPADDHDKDDPPERPDHHDPPAAPDQDDRPDQRESSGSPAPIELRGVSKAYGPTPSLRDVSLTFEPGGCHALVGPNGAGKTTLFRLLLGLSTPDAGTVAVPDVGVGCAFQDPQCYADLTVGENIELFGTLGANDVEDAWTEHLLAACGLERVRHRPASDLSAGFTKRLDVALALLDRPEIVLLDEPLADVDDEHRRKLISLFEDYLSPDRLLVVATHQFEWFEPLLDHVTVLVDGEVRDTVAMSTLRARDADGLSAYYRDRRRPRDA